VVVETLVKKQTTTLTGLRGLFPFFCAGRCRHLRWGHQRTQCTTIHPL